MIKNMELDTEGYPLNDDLKARIHDRIGGLDEFMDTLDRGHVTVSWEGGPNEQTKIRAQVWGPGNKFDGSDVNWKAETAIDKTRSSSSHRSRKRTTSGFPSETRGTANDRSGKRRHSNGRRTR